MICNRKKLLHDGWGFRGYTVWVASICLFLCICPFVSQHLWLSFFLCFPVLPDILFSWLLQWLYYDQTFWPCSYSFIYSFHISVLAYNVLILQFNYQRGILFLNSWGPFHHCLQVTDTYWLNSQCPVLLCSFYKLLNWNILTWIFLHM